MKKKNLLILLIIPFLVSTLTIVSVNVTYNLVDVDISYIEWEYDDIEALKAGEKLKLSAKGVNQRHVDVGKGNELTWSVKNRNSTATEPYAEIVKEGETYYLNAIKNGEVEVTCSNQKGNVSRSFYTILYTDGAIVINSLVPSSGYGRIDYTEYYGTYDLDGANKKPASFEFSVKLIPESLKTANPVLTCSDNITVDFDFANGTSSGGGYLTTGVVKISQGLGEAVKTEEAKISVATDVEDMEIDGGNYAFTLVNDGVNVYDYDDLLFCTNRSEKGEIAVLHKSFESYESYVNSTSGSVACFGYPDSKGKFSFNEKNQTLVKVETKYNHEYLDQWNEVNPSSRVDPSVNVGLKVTKDFYGNGYQINFHNLAYPTLVNAQTNIPEPSETDVFQGPLPFYTVGNPTAGANRFNIVTAYGQDNVGLYVAGDGITVNDLKVQNCDDVQSFAFLDYVGTVVEVDADNVTLKNMRMSNGRNVLRSFSSENLLVENSMLSNARNFLFTTGANEYVKPDNSRVHNFTMGDGSTVTNRLSQFLTAESIANTILNDYINGKIGNAYSYKTKLQMKKVLLEIQESLSTNLAGQYKGDTELKDCLFYRSGITSVAFESLFNGPFLYSSSLPTSISTFLNIFNKMLTETEFMPYNVGGTSYPVSVNVSGKTKFYDYKVFDELDVSGLVGESISDLAQMLGKNYSIDDIFPIKSLLKSNAVYYNAEGVKYVNMPFAYYGGGNNYSLLTFNGYDEDVKSHVNGRIDDNGVLDAQATKNVSLVDNYLDLPVVDPVGFLGQIAPSLGGLNVEVDENTLIKTVTLVTGYEPFKFVFTKGDGYLFGESPKIEDMQAIAATAYYDATGDNAL